MRKESREDPRDVWGVGRLPIKEFFMAALGVSKLPHASRPKP